MASRLDRAERLALVERDQPALPLSVQADLLTLSRSSLYYRPRAPSAEEVALKHRIDALYTQHPFYGSRRIAAQLRREGLASNRKAVQRHMREMGIAGIAPGPNLRRRNSDHRVYPYLLRGVTSAYPNHVWGIEEVYLRDDATPREARRSLGAYFVFYNQARPHQALDYRTPAEAYCAASAPAAARGPGRDA